MFRTLTTLLIACAVLLVHPCARAEATPAQKAVLVTGASSGLGRVMASEMLGYLFADLAVKLAQRASLGKAQTLGALGEESSIVEKRHYTVAGLHRQFSEGGVGQVCKAKLAQMLFQTAQQIAGKLGQCLALVPSGHFLLNEVIPLVQRLMTLVADRGGQFLHGLGSQIGLQLAQKVFTDLDGQISIHFIQASSLQLLHPL